MAQTLSTKSQSFEGTRITVESSKHFDEVITTLYSSIGSDTGKWMAIAKSIKSYSDEAQEEFMSATKNAVGPHGFMIFQVFDHGAWIPLFGVGGGRKMKRIILGNPLIAITMLMRDLTAGLFVPVEMLVIEKEKGGGTEVLYTLPSCLIAGLNKDEKLMKAVRLLDGKLEGLVRDILA